MPLTPGSRYWVPHQEQVFIPALFSGQKGDAAEFSCQDGETLQVPMAKAAELESVSDKQLEGVSNVCSLEEVNNAAVLHTVRTRYLRSPPQIYTRVARIMIAVNPFQSLPIYSASTMKKYREVADAMDLEPHIFAIGSDAVQGIKSPERRNQAVLISGESGAGKTESTKLILSYVSEALVGSSGGIQDKIMQTNPILESFGNAMTVRNNNSSRFGKWLQMTVDKNCSIKGCSVTDYLLELTRVCSQGEKERNYHIFFQLLNAKDDLKDCVIREPQAYRYIKDSQHKAPNVDDKECYQELKSAFTTLGFSDASQVEIFKIVLGVLTLGNCEFDDAGDDTSKLRDETPAKDAAALFGIDQECLKQCLLTRVIKAAGDETVTGRPPSMAEQARDSMARLLYGRLFKYLIRKINSVLSENGPLEGQYFGVLDIAGFESFEINSIEQLSINLSNEHLQAHFNNHIFKMELDDYKAEGIDAAAALTYQDNSDIIALIDSKTSILAILDEEVNIPRASDDTFTGKVIKNFTGHARFYTPKIGGKREFGVRHFAGEVMYTADGWLEKNIDKPPEEAPALFNGSKWGVLKEIGAAMDAEVKESTGGASGPGSKKAKKTVSSSFRASLAALMTTLNQADPNFVRCIKPNSDKVPQKLVSTMVMDQLNFSGVFEAVRIRQSGYASRVAFKDFVCRYRVILPKQKMVEVSKAQKGGKSDAELAQMFVQCLPDALSHVGGFDKKDIALGTTKVFSRTNLVVLLDKARELALTSHVVDIQRVFRGFRVRKSLKECKVVFAAVTKWYKDNRFYEGSGPEHTAIHKLKTPEAIDAQLAELEPKLEKARKMPLMCPYLKEVDSIKRRMASESEAMKGVALVSTSLEPMEVENVIARCEGLSLLPPELKALKARLEALKVQVPLITGAENAMNDKNLEAMTELLDQIQKQGLVQNPQQWLKELNAPKVMDDFNKVLEALKAGKSVDVAAMQKERAAAAAKVAESTQLTSTPSNGVVVKCLSVSAKHSLKPGRSKSVISNKRVFGRQSTVTGLTPEDQSKILLELMGAMEVCDCARLEDALNEAMKQGVKEQDVMKEAKVMYRNLSSEEWLQKTIQEKVKEIDGPNQDGTVLKCLQNLLKQAAVLQVAPEVVESAKKVVQTKVRARARKTMTGKVFEEVDVEEMGLIDSSFANLADFSGLKSVHEWRGHKAPSFFSFGASGPEVMLVHQKQDLREALTEVPPGLEEQCLMAYSNMLGWMYDRPVPEIQRASLMDEIVDTAMQDQMLTDEIYVQVLKQLTYNPSTRSEIQGWKLLHSLCQHVCPSASLFEFVHVFLMNAMRSSQSNHEAAETIKQCIADLNISAAPDSQRQADLVPVQVTLIDSSVRKVRVPANSTLAQLGEITAAQLKMHKANDFAFFQVTDGLEVHRLLPDTTVISTLMERWRKLQDMTSRTSRLMFKRKFLRVDEFLQAGDLSHAMLTYRQAVWDFLHYPIQEDLRAFLEISVRVMFVERDYFKEYVTQGTLANEGVLEQVVPEIVLKEHHRSTISQHLTEMYIRISENLDPNEQRLITMSRALSLMQRLRLFGAYFWPARQVNEVPEEKRSVTDAPKTMCKINAKAADTSYYIAVDYFGIRFLSLGQQSGSLFQKGFLFNQEAVERLIKWGACQNVVQFVVSTVDPTQRYVGRVPMTIAMMTPAAVDIAYAVHLIYSMKGISEDA